jgi:hypothetical protein
VPPDRAHHLVISVPSGDEPAFAPDQLGHWNLLFTVLGQRIATMLA